MSKKVEISAALIEAYNKLVTGIDDKTSLDDKLKIFDRGLKLEQLKIRSKDGDFGSEFDLDGDTEGGNTGDDE